LEQLARRARVGLQLLFASEYASSAESVIVDKELSREVQFRNHRHLRTGQFVGFDDGEHGHTQQQEKHEKKVFLLFVFVFVRSRR
jgi:hypothetical protein